MSPQGSLASFLTVTSRFINDLSPSALQILGTTLGFSYVELERAFDNSKLGSATRLDEDGGCNSTNPGYSLLTWYTLGMLVELITVWNTRKIWTPFRRCAVFFSQNPGLNSWIFLVMLKAAPSNLELTISFNS